MKIIISPAKKMVIERDSLPVKGTPIYIKETKRLMEKIKSLSLEEAKSLWGCNQKIAEQNYERFSNMDIFKLLSPAILSYDGLQFQYMASGVFSKDDYKYIENRLFILSGFYGVLLPFDGVTPYRLEMGSKLSIDGYKNLYEFWGDKIYKAVFKDTDTVINLASKEYSSTVEKHLNKGDKLINVVFGEEVLDGFKQKSTMAKMARGLMVRFIAKEKIENPMDLREFSELGFKFSPKYSSENKIVFLVNNKNS